MGFKANDPNTSADRKKSQEILIDQFQFPIYLHITETQKTFKGGVPKSRR